MRLTPPSNRMPSPATLVPVQKVATALTPGTLKHWFRYLIMAPSHWILPPDIDMTTSTHTETTAPINWVLSSRYLSN